MEEIQRLLIESYGLLTLELRIDWKVMESYFVVSRVNYQVLFNNIEEAKMAFDKMLEKESEGSNDATRT